MKKVTIFQDNTTPLTIDDADNSKLEDYTKQISGLLENNNVSILHVSSCSVILRPNKISSIVVSEISPANNKQDFMQQKQPIKKKPKSSQKKIEKHEDIIHD